MAQHIAPTHDVPDFPLEAVEASIPDHFRRQARVHGSRLAVKAGDQSLTYEQLDRAANRLAHRIVGLLGPGREPVGLLLGPGVGVAVGVLAVLKAGKAFVPLDPRVPEARTAYMLRDSTARLVVTDSRHAGLAARLHDGSVTIIDLDALPADARDDDPGLANGPGDLAYLLYTSGSTGQPKGVMHSHRNALHVVRGNVIGVRLWPDDRICMVGSISFSGTLARLLTALLTGATLCQFDLERDGLARLPSWLAEKRITVLALVTSVFRGLAGVLGEPESLPDLRVIQLHGEPILRQDLDLYKRHFPVGCRLLNVYGCTELHRATQFVMDHQTELATSHAPIGYPLDGIDLDLLDEWGRPVPDGEAGEIVLSSRYLALGYWRRPDLTRAAFSASRDGRGVRTYRTGDVGRRLPDGALVHLGRDDAQVQIKGVRIELAEIESALLAHPYVAAAAVRPRVDPSGATQLDAYVVPARTERPVDRAGSAEAELRHYLGRLLPAEMVPATIVWLDSLPTTPSGKIDRRRLPAPRPADADGPAFPPRTPVERLVADIWADVLGRPAVGRRDSFLALGGDSLLATQVVVRVERLLGDWVSHADLLRCETVERMAEAIVERGLSLMDEDALDRLLSTLGDE